MKKKRLEIKEITVEGSFEGMLSPYGNVDGGGDVVVSGAYAKTLNDQGNVRPVLWQHKTDMPIGTLTLEDRPAGLWCKGQLLMELPQAKIAYTLIKGNVINGLSIGFEAVKDAVENGVRMLKEIKLYEGSIVTFPMNAMARIVSVKGLEFKDDFNEELNEIQLAEAGYQMRSALRQALDSVVWSDLTRDEKITATETIIQQFSDAYMAYIPLYLDMLAETFGGFEMWGAKRLEQKAGAAFSSANKTSIQTHCAMVKENCSDLMDSADTILALVNGDAGTAAKAAATPQAPAAATKTEPVQNHSAATNLIGDIRSLFSQR